MSFGRKKIDTHTHTHTPTIVEETPENPEICAAFAGLDQQYRHYGPHQRPYSDWISMA